MADSVFGTSPTSNYSSSPVSTVDADFELYPMSNAGASSALLIPSYTTNDSPSSTNTNNTNTNSAAAAASATAANSRYGGQLTPSSPVMNDMVGLAVAAAAVSANNVAPVTTADMSMLCHCPGVYPCIPKSSKPLSPFVSAFEPEEDILYEEQQQQQPQSMDNQQQQQQHQQEDGTMGRYQSYDNGYHHDHGHHHYHDHSTSPYASPFTKDHSTSPTSSTSSSSPHNKPLRADRRRSSTYSANGGAGGTGGKSERTQHPLLDPSQVPEIKDIHVCPVCQRRFTRPFNLRSHLMTHTTARPYPCDQCHWKFTRQHDLQRHKRAKHPNSVSSPTTSTLDQQESFKAA
ncbi:hypothetical protein DFQ27_009399 [Actinomortierella ambigua]|uniref:C2H2-type domain-containing protein n=1 Tax=Actinomortierella ambigua TaxID=1343610 RepID=A0A9P6QGT4_9FUNG|nr:hypothetical protein DFQ27_009399 [Actinomortierella ambigua]